MCFQSGHFLKDQERYETFRKTITPACSGHFCDLGALQNAGPRIWIYGLCCRLWRHRNGSEKMTKYRPEFGQHMSDKTYQNAIKLRNTLTTETLSAKERAVLNNTFKTLLHLNRKQAEDSRSFQERTHQRDYNRGRYKEQVFEETRRAAEEAIAKERLQEAFYDQRREEKQYKKQQWQQTSDAIHSTAANHTYTAGPRQKTNTQERVNPIPLIFIIIFILIFLLS